MLNLDRHLWFPPSDFPGIDPVKLNLVCIHDIIFLA